MSKVQPNKYLKHFLQYIQSVIKSQEQLLIHHSLTQNTETATDCMGEATCCIICKITYSLRLSHGLPGGCRQEEAQVGPN